MFRLRLLLAAVAAPLLVPAISLADNPPITQLVIVPGAKGAQGVTTQLCGNGNTLAAVGLIGLLMLAYSLASQIVLIERLGPRNWWARGVGGGAWITAILGTILEFVGHHMPAVVIVGVLLACAGATCLFFLGFGRNVGNVLAFDPAEDNAARNRRWLWNSLFTAGTLIFGLAGLTMIFAGGVNWVWG